MKKILLLLTATFAVCLAVFAGTNMCVKKQNGEILRINIDDVYEVYFEDIFNPDTSIITPPLIEPTVEDVTAYAPLRFRTTSDSTVELTHGEDWDSYRDLVSVNIPSKVKIDGKVYSVTSIGEWVFNDCSSLTSIKIPESVTNIEWGAFNNCKNLNVVIANTRKNVSIEKNSFTLCKSVTFTKDPKITNPSITDALTSQLDFEITSDSTAQIIGCDSIAGINSDEIKAQVLIEGKLYDVTSIRDMSWASWSATGVLIIPSSIIKIEGSLVNGLDSVYVDENNPNYTSLNGIIYDKEKTEIIYVPRGIKGSIYIPSSVTSIGSSAFARCRSLTSIEIPYSVTSISSMAFHYCSSLTSVEIPSSVTSIGYDAFSNCRSLASIEIPSSVTSIGSGAFSGCSNLASIEIPSSVTSIGSEAFEYCENLDVVIDNSKENVKFFDYWGEEATMEESYAFNGVKSVKWLKEIDEDPSVADVSAYAPLRFRTTSDSTVEVTRGDYYDLDSVNIPSKVKIDGKVYSVTSIEEGAFENCSLTSIKIPESVTEIGERAFSHSIRLTSVEIPSSVTSIGSEAFADCNRLESIEIPSSVTSIGSDAFGDCSSLESINVDAKNPNYSSLDGILYNKDKTEIIKVPEEIKGSFSIPSRSFSIPSSVTSIEEGAFYGCSSLTSVEIPSSVTSIGDDAFYGCSSLESINVDAKNPNYSSLDGVVYNKEKTEIIAVPEGIKGSISIPSSVTEIGEKAFYSCSRLTSVEIPSSVTSIGSEAFSSCRSLTSVEIPSSVTSIGDRTFVSCHSLTSVEIPSSVTSIGERAFYSCSSLTSVEIPSSVTSIGSDAFGDCSSLESINVDAKNPNYSSLDGILYNKDKTEIIAVPKGIKGSFSIPSSVTSIGGYAFDGCSLTSVEIPSSVTSIGKYAFYYCRSLTSVEIPSSVTSIGMFAFTYCANLYIVIDNSKENVIYKENAFTGVKSVNWKE